MKAIRLFLPGAFEDAQLYMGHLLLFTADGGLQAIELEPLTKRLETRYADWRGLLTLAFARNDWLSGGPVSSLARNPGVAAALNSGFEAMAGTVLELDTSDVALQHLAGYTHPAGTVLDSEFYARRMYLGTTEGLFHFGVDFDDLAVSTGQRRIDARCVAATAEYGAINASCEADGLFSGFDEFAWAGLQSRGALVQTAHRSLRSAYFGTDLINYEHSAGPERLVGAVKEVEAEPDDVFGRKRKVVVGYGAPTPDPEGVITELERQRKVPSDDIQFVWNSSRAFFINTFEHGFFTAARSTSGLRFARHGRTAGRVVAVHPFPRGWIVETDFAVSVLASGRLHTLLDDEPMTVRTFEGSKRYRRLVAVCVEEGMHLISAVGDF
jgi:hypothetical protein